MTTANLLDDNLAPHLPTLVLHVRVHDHHIMTEVLKAWGHGREKEVDGFQYTRLVYMPWDIWGIQQVLLYTYYDNVQSSRIHGPVCLVLGNVFHLEGVNFIYPFPSPNSPHPSLSPLPSLSPPSPLSPPSHLSPPSPLPLPSLSPPSPLPLPSLSPLPGRSHDTSMVACFQ